MKRLQEDVADAAHDAADGGVGYQQIAAGENVRDFLGFDQVSEYLATGSRVVFHEGPRGFARSQETLGYRFARSEKARR